MKSKLLQKNHFVRIRNSMYNRDIVFAKLEIILNFQKKRRYNFIDRFEFVNDKTTFYKNIRRYIE